MRTARPLAAACRLRSTTFKREFFDVAHRVTHRSSARTFGHVGHGRQGQRIKAAGKKVYDFSVGEPDFTTPEHICQAAVAAMKAGHTHYTAASGIPELRAAIAKQ